MRFREFTLILKIHIFRILALLTIWYIFINNILILKNRVKIIDIWLNDSRKYTVQKHGTFPSFSAFENFIFSIKIVHAVRLVKITFDFQTIFFFGKYLKVFQITAVFAGEYLIFRLDESIECEILYVRLLLHLGDQIL